ncbi:kinetochore protein Spc25, animal type [Marchantia polymorpha subsp. ruderalis]
MKGDVVPGLSDKQAFREELDELAQTIGLWAADYIDGVEKCQSTALLLKGTGQEKALELKELLRNLQEESGRIEAALGDQQETLKSYRKWIAQIKDREAAFGERISQLLEAKRRGEDKVSVAMAEISGKLDHRKNKLDALRKATSWYKELLGIRCEYSNAVKFIFTNIDPNNPEREFSFSIHHDKSANKFSMVDCSPHIDRSGPLLDSLNTSNELSQFVRSMRWEFVTLATGESKV